MKAIDDPTLPFDDAPTTDIQDSRACAIRGRRNIFRQHEAPTDVMGKMLGAWTISRTMNRPLPDELAPIVDWFNAEDDARDRFRWVLRDSLDELLDGQRTGRWAYQHLSKTEGTHLGTVVEVNLTKEFKFDDGMHLDWQIAGRDVDCKFSKTVGGWEIPIEMYLCSNHKGGRPGGKPITLRSLRGLTTPRIDGPPDLSPSPTSGCTGNVMVNAATTATTSGSSPLARRNSCTGCGAACRPICRATCCCT